MNININMANKRSSKRRRGFSAEDQEELDFYNDNKIEVVKASDLNQLSQIQFKANSALKTDSQKKLAQKIRENKVTFIKGAAGTGKTYASLKAALEVLKDKKEPNNDTTRLFLSKPIVEAGDENIGFLPGDKDQKTAPYYSSFYSNIEKLVGKETAKFLKGKFIEEKIIAYERGSTFDNCVAIFDEAQNLTINGLKLFISRLGENAKMIIMGDTDQIDIKLKDGQKSGLDDAFTRFEGIEGIAFHEFTEDDIVRSKIRRTIMKRY